MNLNKFRLVAIKAVMVFGGSVFASSDPEEIMALDKPPKIVNNSSVYVRDFSSMNMGSIRTMIECANRITNYLPKNLDLRDQSDLDRYTREFIAQCRWVLKKYTNRQEHFSAQGLQAGEDVEVNWIIDTESGTLKLKLCRLLEKIDNLQLDHIPELTKEIGIITELGKTLKLLPE